MRDKKEYVFKYDNVEFRVSEQWEGEWDVFKVYDKEENIQSLIVCCDKEGLETEDVFLPWVIIKFLMKKFR